MRGSRGLVVGTASPIAVEAGAGVLREGGSAADAAVATALTQITTMLGANVSYAGIAQLVYFEARTGRVYALDAGWGSWRGERSPATIPDADLSLITGAAPIVPAAAEAGRKTLVPGFMAGMAAMHRRFGRLRFARLFEPAIWYAEHGVPVTPLLASYMAIGTTPLLRTPAGRRFALPDGVNLPRGGERFVQRDLARLLRQVSRQGARPMYRGAWARNYVEAVRAAGGAATLADLQSYAPRWGEPLRVAFRGATIAGPDPTNGNGCIILEALNLIDHADVTASYWQDADALRTLTLALRVAQWSHFSAAAAAFERGAGVGGSCEARAAPAYGAAAAPAMASMLGGGAEGGGAGASQRFGGGGGSLGQCRGSGPFQQLGDVGRYRPCGGRRADSGPGGTPPKPAGRTRARRACTGRHGAGADARGRKAGAGGGGDRVVAGPGDGTAPGRPGRRDGRSGRSDRGATAAAQLRVGERVAARPRGAGSGRPLSVCAAGKNSRRWGSGFVKSMRSAR